MDSTPHIKEELIAGIAQAYDTLISSLQPLTDKQFNHSPFEGSWSPAQVADHIIKASAGIPDKNIVPAERPFNEKAAVLETQFLNFDKKLKAPDFILPGNEPLEKQEIIEKLQALKSKHIYKIGKNDLTALCLDFELPFMGTMTRYEWYKFIIVHIKRHLFQLGNILDGRRET